MAKIIATLTPSGCLGRYRVRCLEPHCFQDGGTHYEQFGEAEKAAAWHVQQQQHVTVIEDMEANDRRPPRVVPD